MAHRPRIWPIRITPWPPKPEMRISVRVLAGACVAISVRSFPGAVRRHLLPHPSPHLPQQLRELRPAVGGVVLDAGLPGEVAGAAVGRFAGGMLMDPFQVL